MIELPQSIVVFPDERQPDRVRALVDGLREKLPHLSVQVVGVAPKPPYAVCEFIPDDMRPYADTDWVHISGAGANGMLAALARDDVHPALITRTVGEMGTQIGEYVLSYILSDLQKHKARNRFQSRREWNSTEARPDRLSGLKALIFGTGGIGSGVAGVLSAVGVRCTGINRRGHGDQPFERCYAFDCLPDDLSEFDVAVAALPFTKQTDGAVNLDLLSRLESVQFFNVGRGPTLNHSDLSKALSKGFVRQVILDVFTEEPLPPDNELWTLPSVTITPHVSGLTQPEDTVDAFVSAYRALERGERPALTVDPEAGY